MTTISSMEDIKGVISSMSLEEKVGHVCCPILQSSDIPEGIEKAVRQYGVGIVRYCINGHYDIQSKLVGPPNRYLSPADNAKLTNRLQTMAMETRLGIPLMIGSDQEGGTRNDLNRYGSLVYGSHMTFGAVDDTELTYKTALACGREMRSIGINLIQAPITDVISFSGRGTIRAASFGESPDMVIRHAKAMQKGFKQAGLATMIKHFPGYGATAVDAHKGLARVVKTREELDSHDNLPLRELIADGADGIMTGHVIIESLDDSETPATLSARIIKGILRDEWKFDGIVETDAMRMPGIQEKYGTQEAVVMAIQAGCDAVLLRGDYDHFLEGYEAILEAVRDGRIQESDLEESIRRILTLKRKINLFENPYVDPDEAESIIGCAEHKELSRDVAQRSVCLLKNKNNLLPLSLEASKRIFVLSAEPSKLDGANDPIQSVDMLIKAVTRQHENTAGLMIDMKPTDDQAAEAVKSAENADVIIVGAVNATNNHSQADLVKQLRRLNKTMIVVAFECPYDIIEFPEVDHYIATLGTSNDAMIAAAEIIFGKRKAAGKIPVTIPSEVL